MLVSFDALAQQFAGYTDVKGKIRREVQGGKLVQVARGLYETDARADGKYLAGAIYGPSYLSFDYALSVHALIPEAVYSTYTSATFRKGKTKRYENAFGTFLYRDVPAAVYPLGVEIKVEGGYSYQIASPEKALCDKLYSLSPVYSVRALKELLFDDLRIDEAAFFALQKDDILQLAPLYRATNLKLLAKFMEGK